MSEDSTAHEQLLTQNRKWVDERLAGDPSYFERRARGQSPTFLWIGCSDSRVPAEVVTGAEPGDLFVHRNIANLVVHTDLNVLSVVQYAVEVLKVPHVIVCGHTGCGGVAAAASRQSFGLIDNWLRHVKDVYRLHAEELDAIADPEARNQRLVELNVIEQVQQLGELSFVQRAFREETRPTLHGWVYDLRSGLLSELARIDPGHAPHGVYRYEPDEP